MQIVEFGNQKIQKLTDILKIEEPKRILLLRGSKSYDNLPQKISELIKFPYKSFSLSKSNTSLEQLSEAISFYDKNGCDLVLAVGGGSVIDLAKLISIFSANRFPIADYLKGKKKYTNRVNSLIAIPTTSGSGSEATHFAVVYDGITKYSVAHNSLLPDYAIIDPELTYTLSPHQTAVSGLDALCQGIESFWSLQSTSKSKEYSRESIKLVLKNIETAVLNPTRRSRVGMSRGSYLAGKAINIAKTTAAHAFSYPLTKLWDIPHGHAVSLSIGKFYEHNCREDLHKKNISSEKFLINTMSELNRIMNVTDGHEGKTKINSIIARIGLPLKLPDNIDYGSTVSSVIENVNLERLANNPVEVKTEDLSKIFKSICS